MGVSLSAANPIRILRPKATPTGKPMRILSKLKSRGLRREITTSLRVKTKRRPDPTIDKLTAAIVSGCGNCAPLSGPHRVHFLSVSKHLVAIAIQDVPTHIKATATGSAHFLDRSAELEIDDSLCRNCVLLECIIFEGATFFSVCRHFT